MYKTCTCSAPVCLRKQFFEREVTEEMGRIEFTQNHSSPRSTTGIGDLTRVSGNKGQDSTRTQHDQPWYSRLSCWIKDSVQPFYSPSQQSAPFDNTTWVRLSQGSGGDQSIATGKKTFPEMKITQWNKEGALAGESRAVQSL